MYNDSKKKLGEFDLSTVRPHDLMTYFDDGMYEIEQNLKYGSPESIKRFRENEWPFAMDLLGDHANRIDHPDWNELSREEFAEYYRKLDELLEAALINHGFKKPEGDDND